MFLSLERSSSFQTSRRGWIKFWIRRVLRIAPAFWLAAVLWYFSTGGSPNYWFPEGSTLFTLAVTIFFLGNWWPTMHSAIVPGGWSVSAEMNMYGLVPILKERLSRTRQAAVWLICSMMLGGILSILGVLFLAPRFPYPSLAISFFNSYWLPVCLPSFIAGILAYRWISGGEMDKRWAIFCIGFSVLAFLLISYSNLPLKAVLVAPIFGMFVLGIGSLNRYVHLPIPRAVTWMGKISYSAYFWHFVVLYLLESVRQHTGLNFGNNLLRFPFIFGTVFLSSFLLSSASYVLLEQPANRLARSLCRKIDESINSSVLQDGRAS